MLQKNIENSYFLNYPLIMKPVLNFTFLEKYESHPFSMSFNCWGGTVMYFRQSKNPRKTWLTSKEMKKWTKEFCEEIFELEVNAIISLYRDSDKHLIHSMVYLGNDQVWHKIGAGHSEITSLENALNEYLYDEDGNTCSTIKIFRLKQKGFSLNHIKQQNLKKRK